MTKCSKCGEEVMLPFMCSYCGQRFCEHHRLPENHDCPNLMLAKRPPLVPRVREVPRPGVGTRGFSLGKSEAQHLLIAWVVLGFCFAAGDIFAPQRLPRSFALSLLTIGVGFIFHELAHKYVAQRYGYWAEFRIWIFGLALALMMAVLTGGRLIFAAPGAVHIVSLIPTAWGRELRRQRGLIALSGSAANIAVALLFLSITSLGGMVGQIGLQGYRVNLWLAAFNTLPVAPLDGQEILRWDPRVWAAVCIPIWIALFLLI